MLRGSTSLRALLLVAGFVGACSGVLTRSASALQTVIPVELLRQAREVLQGLAPEVLPATALAWPAQELECERGESLEASSRAEVAAVCVAWDEWRAADRKALERALDGVERMRVVEAREGNRSSPRATGVIPAWASHIASYERDRAQAAAALRSRLLEIGLSDAHADEVLCRTRRQVWLARNRAQDRSVSGRRSDIFETCARADAGLPTTTGTTALASVFPMWEEALSARVAPALRESTREWRDLWVANMLRFDAALQAEHALRTDQVQRIFAGGTATPRLAQSKDAARRLDRLQEEFAGAVMQLIARNDEWSALRWRHGDRTRAYPLLTMRGAPDKLYDEVCAYVAVAADAVALEPNRDPPEKDEILLRAREAFALYLREREVAEQAIVRTVLRDASRGAPIPYLRSASEPRDPDLDEWNRALMRRLDAGRQAVAALGGLLPPSLRAGAIARAQERTPEEANNLFIETP